MNTLHILESLVEAHKIVKTAQHACYSAAGAADEITLKLYRVATYISGQQKELLAA